MVTATERFALTVAELEELEKLRGDLSPKFSDPAQELKYRRDRECCRRRIKASWRMEPLPNGVVDSLAPNGRRWAA